LASRRDGGRIHRQLQVPQDFPDIERVHGLDQTQGRPDSARRIIFVRLYLLYVSA
jgi:hypothetical protein